jgi:hypothetical protein
MIRVPRPVFYLLLTTACCEPVSAELPGDLAASAGRLSRRLASEGLKGIANDQKSCDQIPPTS